MAWLDKYLILLQDSTEKTIDSTQSQDNNKEWLNMQEKETTLSTKPT